MGEGEGDSYNGALWGREREIVIMVHCGGEIVIMVHCGGGRGR